MTQHEYVISVNIADCHWTKVFNGYYDDSAKEGFDYMNSLIAQYIADNRITNPEEQDYVIEQAYYSITYDTQPYIEMYAVYEETAIIGVYPTRAEAEEAILAECEDFAEEVINTSDVFDTVGKEEWEIKEDYWRLATDAGSCYDIEIIPAFGVEIVE